MRGKKGGSERKNMRMVRPRDKGSDESDEDYNVGEDEEFDESDDEYGLTYDVDETEEILDLLEDGEEFVSTKMKKVGRPNVKKAGRARRMKITGAVKPKKRRILHREEDEEEEEENDDDDDDDGDGDDEDYNFDEEMTNKVAKPQRKKRVTFREEDDDYVCADDDFEDEKEVARRRKKKRMLYKEEDDDDDYNGVADDFNDEKVLSVVKARGKKSVSYREEDDDDYNGSDHDVNDKRVNSVVKPRGKKRVSYREDDDDDYCDSDDILNDKKVNSVVKVSYREEDDNFDVTEDQSDDEVSKVAKPGKGKEVLYREEDDDDNDNDYNGAGDEFDDERVVAVKPRGKRRVSYRVEEDDDDDDDDDDYDGADEEYDDGEVNLIVKPRGKRRVSYRVEEDDYDGADGEFEDEEVDLVVKPRGRSMVSYREDDVDYDGKDGKFDDEEKVIKVANQRKKKEVSYREKDDDYDGMDDDDDGDDHDAMDDDDDYEEEEFTPNEIDGVDDVDDVDDEDELLVVKENKKLGRPRVQKECVIGGWKRKRKRNWNVSNKIMIIKPIKNHQPSRKRETENDNALIISKTIVEEKKEKVSERRRGRIVHSDSDFVISGSSDYEYTISEDEREQIHEANKFCRSLTTSLRNSTSSSKLNEEKIIPTRRKRIARKGKEKVEDLKVEVVKQVCGICLTEEGKRTVRGTLNCCSHYFCFACIMEWSKVESRCPLCKQRFGTISKPARSNTGFDLRTAVIQIPERDQVYQPSEEELLGFLDPYDYVICTECHHGGDDALMLLCDLCDSPAHTYCVGLGHEVPEGNWYCEGCRPAALGSSNPHVSTPRPSSPVSNIRETFDLNEMYVPETPLIHESSQLPSPRPSVGDVQLPSPAFGSGAFTVHERRRIHHQIHQLIRRQMDFRAPEMPTTVSGHNLFDAQVDRLATQHVVTPEMMYANNIYFPRSFHDNTTPVLQNPEIPSTRLTPFHLSQNQPSTSTSGSFNGYIQNEFDGLNSSIGLRLGHQQLQPCSSRSNTGSDANTSSYPFREGTVPSVTLQGALHTHF